MISGPWRGHLFGLYPGAPNGGIFYFLTLANDILADRLDRRFVHHTSAVHRPDSTVSDFDYKSSRHRQARRDGSSDEPTCCA